MSASARVVAAGVIFAAALGAEPRLIVIDTAKTLGAIDVERVELRVTAEAAARLSAAPVPFGLPRWTIEPNTPNAMDPRSDAASRAALFASSAVDALVSSPRSPFVWRFGASEQEIRAASWLASFAESPVRATATGGDGIGFAVLAGISRDRRNLRVLIANYEKKPAPEGVEYRDNDGYRIKIEGLPWGMESFRSEVWTLDGDAPARSGSGRGGRFRLRRSMPPPGVELVVLRRQDTPIIDLIPRRRSR